MKPEQEKTLERLIYAVEQVYLNKKRLLWTNLVAGIMRGVGAALGTAVILAAAALIFGVWENVTNWLDSAKF